MKEPQEDGERAKEDEGGSMEEMEAQGQW